MKQKQTKMYVVHPNLGATSTKSVTSRDIYFIKNYKAHNVVPFYFSS